MSGEGAGPSDAGFRGVLLPGLSGLLLALCFPPLHIPVLPFLALVPLGVWIHRLPPGPQAARSSLRGGAVLGALYFGLLFHWIPIVLVVADSTPLSVVLAGGSYAVIVGGLATLTALFVRLLHGVRHQWRAPLWLALPVMWTALEWTRAHLPDSLALSWLGLGSSLTAFPELVGIAELVGVRGVTFWLASVNGLLATLWLSRREAGGRWRWMAVTLGVVVLPMMWGVWRAATLETRMAARVAVIQPNVADRTKVPAAPDVRALPSLPPIESDVDLVVLPELFVRGAPTAPEAGPVVDRLREYSRSVDAPLLFGGLGRPASVGRGGPLAPFNSAFLMEPEGLAAYRYDKRRLVPVVERIPFVPDGMSWAASLGAYAVGEGWPLAVAGGARFGALICYESSYPEAARALRRAGADVLVNLTNDAWLGGRPWYARTVALWQHPAHLVMRAIESRVGVVRSANTGISFVVDPVGRIHQRTELFTEAVTVGEVLTTDGPTLFVRLGDLAGRASALVAFGLFLALVWRPAAERG